MLLLAAFPTIILVLVWVFLAALGWLTATPVDYGATTRIDWQLVNERFLHALPWVVGIVGVWFAIAYFFNAEMVSHAVHAQPISRKDNPRVYNIVENLCIACNMPMPRVCIVHDPQLNAFASGINERTYAVTLTTGIIDRLDDEELAGVIGHELTHIRNHDTKLLITSIVFVGIISTVMALSVRMLYHGVLHAAFRSNKKNNGAAGALIVLLIAVVLSFVAYIFTLLTRFAISRKREYMADAGGAELCGNPLALASALRKISANPGLDHVQRADVAQLFICRPDEMEQGIMGFVDSLFSTHPDPKKRIAILEQF